MSPLGAAGMLGHARESEKKKFRRTANSPKSEANPCSITIEPFRSMPSALARAQEMNPRPSTELEHLAVGEFTQVL